jgi:hypothetical protein
VDKSLAKGLTKRFIREYPVVALRELRDIQSSLSKTKSQKKKQKKLFDRIRSNSNSLCMAPNAFGSEKKRYISFTIFDFGDRNPLGYDEQLLLPTNILYARNHDDVTSAAPQFGISHHAIQRFFERSDLVSADSFEDSFKFIIKETRYLFFWCFFLKTQLVISLMDKSHLWPYVERFSFLIPSPNGIFLAECRRFEVDDGSAKAFFRIKTFLSLKELSSSQLSLRLNMIDISQNYHREPFSCIRDYVPFFEVEDHHVNSVWWFTTLCIWRYFVKIGFVDKYIAMSTNENFDQKALREIKEQFTDTSQFDYIPDAIGHYEWESISALMSNNIISGLVAVSKNKKTIPLLNFEDFS